MPDLTNPLPGAGLDFFDAATIEHDALRGHADDCRQNAAMGHDTVTNLDRANTFDEAAERLALDTIATMISVEMMQDDIDDLTGDEWDID